MSLNSLKIDELEEQVEDLEAALKETVWRRIEEYDYLPPRKTPKNAVFRFQPNIPNKSQHISNSLPEMFSTERRRGSRICTHWMALPPIPEEDE